MAHTVLGLFTKVNETASAVKSLESIKINHDNMKVMTSAQYPEGTFFEDHTPTPLWLFPIIFGLGGTCLAFALAGGTQLLINLYVGGKYPFSMPAVAVVGYELTLGGAVVGSLIGFLLMAGLPDWRNNAYDEEITNGLIGLLINCDDAQQASEVEEVMKSSGATETKLGRDDF